MDSIKYTLTYDEYKDFAKYLHKIQRIRKSMMKTQSFVYITLFICMFVFFWSIIDGGQIDWRSLSAPVIAVILRYFACCIFVYVFVCILLWFISTRDIFNFSARAMFRYSKGQSLDIEMKITEDGLSVSNGKASADFKWDGIKDIYKSRNSIFIFVSDYFAYIVPERAFKSYVHFDEFFKYIETKLSKN